MINRSQIIGIIPARYASTRFPAKLLAPILGKTLIQRTYENARRCKALDRLIVATDHEDIANHVTSFGGEVVITSPECTTGTERLAEAISHSIECTENDIIVNIQGDEPCLDPDTIVKVANILANDSNAVMSTAATICRDQTELQSTSVVKCVFSQTGDAIYFSRALIPHSKLGVWNAETVYYRHIGLYAYRRDFLLQYMKLAPTPLQLAEDLEQLKVLEQGFKIKVAVVEEAAIGVDNPEDIEKIEKILCNQNTFL
ncbi:MAG: kdsB [Chlamydiales bacterium]|jgi:3-deoxy-manno-octulosonate cytidylyltransferase (CMP-KDO synthetase)|nr:kdsB [Chlamydiales bacterium]